MQNVLILLVVAIIVVGLACGTSKKSTSKTAEENPTAPSPYAPTLQDIWVLETMDDKALDRKKNRPRLELSPAKGRIVGTGGCNELFGQMQAKGWNISFNSVGTTKRFCRDLMEMEGRFLQLLGEVDNYKIKGLKLILMAGDDATLVFQKVD